MQVNQLVAGDTLQRSLHVGQPQLQFAARARNPEESLLSRRVRQAVLLGDAASIDAENAHGVLSRRRCRLQDLGVLCSAGAQQLRGLQREVGQHPVGPGALERQQALHHHGVMV